MYLVVVGNRGHWVLLVQAVTPSSQSPLVQSCAVGI